MVNAQDVEEVKEVPWEAVEEVPEEEVREEEVTEEECPEEEALEVGPEEWREETKW